MVCPPRWTVAPYLVVVQANELRFAGTDIAGAILQLFESCDESSGIRSK